MLGQPKYKYALSEYAYLKDLAIAIHEDIQASSKPFEENPSLDTFKALLDNVSLEQHGNQDFARILFFSLLNRKVSDFPSDNPNAETLRTDLQEALMENLRGRTLPKSQQKIFNAIHSFQESLNPVLKAGKHSEAKKQADARQEKNKAFASQLLGLKENPNEKDLETYRAFLKEIHSSRRLTLDDLKQFKADLEDPSSLPFSEKKQSTLDTMKSTMKQSAAFMMTDEWQKKTPSLHTEEKNQIKVLNALLNSRLVLNDSILENAKQQIEASHRIEKARHNRQVGTIIDRIMLNGGKNPKDFEALAKAVAHPFKKILNNPNLSPQEKLVAVTQKAGSKTAELGRKASGVLGEATLSLTKDAIKKPFEATHKMGESAANAMEIFKLYGLHAIEKEPEAKEKLSEKIAKETDNLSYNSRKMLEALLLSAASYVAISELVASSGALAPAVLIDANESITALLSAHTMEVLYMMDTVKTPAEFMNLLMDTAAKSDDAGTEKEQLSQSIQSIIDEIILTPPHEDVSKIFITSMGEIEEEKVAPEKPPIIKGTSLDGFKTPEEVDLDSPDTTQSLFDSLDDAFGAEDASNSKPNSDDEDQGPTESGSYSL